MGQRDRHRQTLTDCPTCLIAVSRTAELRSTVRVDEVLARDVERERGKEKKKLVVYDRKAGKKKSKISYF